VNTTSRKDVLRVGGVAIVVLLLGGSCLEPVRAAGRKTALAPARDISPHNTATRNREALLKALTNSDLRVIFTPGDYLIDNTGTPIVIENFEGTFAMQPGARLIFTDSTCRGLLFVGGRGAVFRDLRTVFQNSPTQRVDSRECLEIRDTLDTVVQNVSVDGSAAAGLLFARCVRPSVWGATIANTMADGLHFANCQDAKANDVLTEDTGDDGVAFVNYGDGPDHSGGQATNVTVRRSKARGIAVVGQSGVLVRGFSVEGTACSGLYCAYEASYRTRVPSNVRFEGGTVTNAGRAGDCAPSNHGIEYYDVESVGFEKIKVVSPECRGVSGSAPGGTVHLIDIEVRGAAASGFDLTEGKLHLDDLICRVAGGIGFSVRHTELLEYRKLTSINASTVNGLHRAFSIEHNARVEGGELHVIDDQDLATGYKVLTDGRQAGSLGVIHTDIANGNLEVENHSGLKVKGVQAHEAPTGSDSQKH
jgi:hypothetical protein